MCNCCNKPYCFIFNFCIIFFPPFNGSTLWCDTVKVVKECMGSRNWTCSGNILLLFFNLFFYQHCLRSQFIKDWMNHCSVFYFFCVLNCVVIHKQIPSFHFKMKVHSEKKVKNKNLKSTLIYSKYTHILKNSC